MPACLRTLALLVLVSLAPTASPAWSVPGHDHRPVTADLTELQSDLRAFLDRARAASMGEGKCATLLLHAARQRFDELEPEIQEGLRPYLAPPVSLDPTVRAKVTRTFESPGGFFVVEYDTEGTDAVSLTDVDTDGVPDYVEWVAEAFDESWTEEFDVLGFPAPGLQPGERYLVDLRATGGVYGFTQIASATPGETFIVLNADFFGFYAARPGLIGEDPDGKVRGGIRVTAAHELKHASQWIESQWSENPQGWLETDATWMEDVVFDQVNDYYNYLPDGGSPFTSPTTSLVNASYEDATWQHFLLEAFGIEVLLDYGDRRSLRRGAELPQFSFRAAVEANGLVWREVWREYGVWNYLSGNRATTALGFEEGARYPTSRLTSVSSALPIEGPTLSLSPLAFAFHQLDNARRDLDGPIAVTLEGGSGAEWVASLVLQSATELVWRPVPVGALGTGTLLLDDRDLSEFDRVALVVGNASVTTSTAATSYSFRVDSEGQTVVGTRIALALPHPNPFSLATKTRVDFSISRGGAVDMDVYDLRGRHVRTLVEGEIFSSGPQSLSFDGRDDAGERLASGVYFLRARFRGLEATQRLVLVK